MSVEIRPFEISDQQGLIHLILPIQQNEFGIPITLDDQPDLLDVPGFYQRGTGNLWIARVDGEVVGSIALLDISGGRGALRKMFVRECYRGGSLRIAPRLLETLMQWAEDKGLRKVFLGTTAQFHAAHRFYEKHGFQRISREALPESFPVMQVDTRFYQIRLAAP